MRILINDGMSAEGVDMLRKAGHDVVTDKIPQEELPSKISAFDVIVVRSATKVHRDVIDAGIPRLKAIVRGGVGVDNIDVTYAQEKGVRVMNTPAASSDSVAELALAHMFALARHLAAANVSMRAGKWEKKAYEGIELAGKTLGILGMGRIGQSLALKAIAIGMNVIAYDPLVHSVDMPIKLTGPDEVISNADFLSLHIPAQKDGPAIGREQFGRMKTGAYLINCARGGVVDEEALIEALDSGKLAGAGLDVFIGEPSPNPKLVNHIKVSVTPHIGASTREAQERIGAEVAALLIEFARSL